MLPNKYVEEERDTSESTPTKSNVSRHKRQALKNLKANNDVVVILTEKVNATTVLNT